MDLLFDWHLRTCTNVDLILSVKRFRCDRFAPFYFVDDVHDMMLSGSIIISDKQRQRSRAPLKNG